MTRNQLGADRVRSRDPLTWELERPDAVLPSSYLWTWDHSTNWVLDDPGLQSSGCYNSYLKRPETFIEDYRRLTDLCAGLGIRGIVVWGFLRDSHGGVDAAKRVAAYAASQGVAIMPGFGTTWYGGAYYEGDHRYSLQAFLKDHPDARMLKEDGSPYEHRGEYGACPSHPAYRQWLHESLGWLFREFEIGGINIENGDFLTDYHPLTQEARARWSADDPEAFFFQGLSYTQALEALADVLPNTLATYATYAGFNLSEAVTAHGSGMGGRPPAMFEMMPEQGICQWTITSMLLPRPLPLVAYLDDGAPAAAFDNPNWPSRLRPPCRRSVGYAHQGSQWSANRYGCIISTIKEACLRAYHSGLEGVSFQGEVTSHSIPNALNYLAFSHFTHWPEDTVRDFGRKTLGQVLGSEQAGEEYVTALAQADAGIPTDETRRSVLPENRGFSVGVCALSMSDVEEYRRFRFWEWLGETLQGRSAPPIAF